MAVGGADRDVMDPILIRFVHRQDAIRREAVDRRHHRGVDQRREGVGGKVGLVVDQIEPAGLREQVGEVAELPHLGVDARVFRIGGGDHAVEGAGGLAIEGREQGDVDAPRPQPLGQQRGHQLPRAVSAGRGAPRDRGEHRDFHVRISPSFGSSMPSLCRGGSVDASTSPPNGARRGSAERLSMTRTISPSRRRS